MVRILARLLGLGDSIRDLRTQDEVATELLTGDIPDELVRGLGDLIDHPDARVAGWHLITFSEVKRTGRWRQELLLSFRGAVL